MNKMFAIREQKFAHDNPLAIMGEEGDPPIPHHLFPGWGHPPPTIFSKRGSPPSPCVREGGGTPPPVPAPQSCISRGVLDGACVPETAGGGRGVGG